MELDIGNPVKSIFGDGTMIRISDATVFFVNFLTRYNLAKFVQTKFSW